MIKTVYESDQEIICNILDLHSPNGCIDLDPTYSTGRFYKSGIIKEPKLRFDIEPRDVRVIESDVRDLPLGDESIQTTVFDPPFLATTGPSLKKSEGNVINRRFGVYPNEKELHQFYIDSLKELYRVTKQGGILIFKCQDKVSSGTQYFSHVFIHDEAQKVGWYAKDLFILKAKNRIVANWQRNQKHARKFHSYYWVFQKSSKKVRYN